MLIGTIDAHLNDFFGGIFLEKIFKNLFKSLKKLFNYFVKVCVQNLPKICHFQSFPSPITSPFIVLQQWLHVYYTTFEGPNVNEIISYFGHL
jgi:hypothetical protein